MPITFPGGLVLYSVEELSKRLRVHPVTFRRYIGQGKIKAQKIGGTFYVSEESLADFFRQSTAPKAKRIPAKDSKRGNK